MANAFFKVDFKLGTFDLTLQAHISMSIQNVYKKKGFWNF